MDRYTVESFFEKFDVVGVGSADGDSQRHTVGVSEHRAFGAQFSAISGILARIFPHPEAT